MSNKHLHQNFEEQIALDLREYEVLEDQSESIAIRTYLGPQKQFGALVAKHTAHNIMGTPFIEEILILEPSTPQTPALKLLFNVENFQRSSHPSAGPTVEVITRDNAHKRTISQEFAATLSKDFHLIEDLPTSTYQGVSGREYNVTLIDLMKIVRERTSLLNDFPEEDVDAAIKALFLRPHMDPKIRRSIWGNAQTVHPDQISP